MTDLLSIANQFQITGKIQDIIPLGSGHIHETFRVVTEGADINDYVLQQINTNVFRDPEAVMQNLDRVTSHIRQKMALSGFADTKRLVITPVRLCKGDLLYADSQKRSWRCSLYISGHKTVDLAESEDMVYEGGKAYGKFLQLLADLPVTAMRETIPGFHSMVLRLNQFEDACRNGLKERIIETGHEIELLRARKDDMLTIQHLRNTGEIPLRIVHHDTKINNVLFDENNKGLCVIDLDTVMPGTVHDDFGDSIRTFTNTGEEDDADTERVGINLDYYRAYATGFLESAGNMLNMREKENLALSARIMTYMQSLRFLTDYLNGDVYYRVHHDGHNLQRARAQIRLLLSMEEGFGEMLRITNALL